MEEKPTENHKANEPLTQKVITIYINLSEKKIILCCNIVKLKLWDKKVLESCSIKALIDELYNFFLILNSFYHK